MSKRSMKKTVGWYKAAAKQLRPFADLGLDLRRTLKPHEKALIARYHNALFVGSKGEPGILAGKEGAIRRVKTQKQRVLGEKAIYGKSLGLPRLRGLLIEKGQKVRFLKSGKVAIRAGEIRIEYLYFDYDRLKGSLSEFFASEVDRLTAGRDSDELYEIVVGEGFVLAGSGDPPTITRELQRMGGKYANAVEFVRGLKALRFDFQISADEYLARKEERKRAQSRKRKARKRQLDRKGTR